MSGKGIKRSREASGLGMCQSTVQFSLFVEGKTRVQHLLEKESPSERRLLLQHLKVTVYILILHARNHLSPYKTLGYAHIMW